MGQQKNGKTVRLLLSHFHLIDWLQNTVEFWKKTPFPATKRGLILANHCSPTVTETISAIPLFANLSFV